MSRLSACSDDQSNSDFPNICQNPKRMSCVFDGCENIPQSSFSHISFNASQGQVSKKIYVNVNCNHLVQVKLIFHCNWQLAFIIKIFLQIKVGLVWVQFWR